jgi:hypothetical protein
MGVIREPSNPPVAELSLCVLTLALLIALF